MFPIIELLTGLNDTAVCLCKELVVSLAYRAKSFGFGSNIVKQRICSRVAVFVRVCVYVCSVVGSTAVQGKQQLR